MSRNKCMHRRNVFISPPDYTELAIKYSDFRRHCNLSLGGKVVLNLKNVDALQALTQTLLLEYFNLWLTFAPNSLIPTLPLRLNYILWIEDVLDSLTLKSVHGIDIGCGSSCIYSLLGARKNNWKMTALEANETNIQFASQNIKENNLSDLVDIFHQKNKNIVFSDFFESIDASEKFYDFCVCNPPFFSSSEKGLQKSNTRNPVKRKKPKNCHTGLPDELFCDGGEVNFIQGFIDESQRFPLRIRVFTTMLGHKSSLTKIVDYLKSKGIENFITTEFCQGNTTRWGVGWSFRKEIQLKETHFENDQKTLK